MGILAAVGTVIRVMGIIVNTITLIIIDAWLLLHCTAPVLDEDNKYRCVVVDHLPLLVAELAFTVALFCDCYLLP